MENQSQLCIFSGGNSICRPVVSAGLLKTQCHPSVAFGQKDGCSLSWASPHRQGLCLGGQWSWTDRLCVEEAQLGLQGWWRAACSSPGLGSTWFLRADLGVAQVTRVTCPEVHTARSELSQSSFTLPGSHHVLEIVSLPQKQTAGLVPARLPLTSLSARVTVASSTRLSTPRRWTLRVHLSWNVPQRFMC